MLRYMSPAARKAMAVGTALMVGIGLAPPRNAGTDTFREEEEFPDFAQAAKVDEVRPGRKLRVIALTPPSSGRKLSSNKTVFLAHGATSRAAIMYPLARQLHDMGYRVIAFDGFSCGRAPAGPLDESAYTTQEYKQDFEALFAKYAGGKGTNVVVGHSFGSVLSVHVASKEPEKVAGAVLIGSGSPEAVSKVDISVFSLPLWLLESRAMTTLIRMGFPAQFFHQDCDKKIINDGLQMTSCNSMFVVKAFWTQMNWMDEATMKLVQQPVQVIHGTHDKILPLSGARELLPLFPKRTSIHVIEGAGHNVVLEKPEETARIIHEFASSLPNS